MAYEETEKQKKKNGNIYTYISTATVIIVFKEMSTFKL